MALELPQELAELRRPPIVGFTQFGCYYDTLGIDADIQQLIDVCGYTPEQGTTTIGSGSWTEKIWL